MHFQMNLFSIFITKIFYRAIVYGNAMVQIRHMRHSDARAIKELGSQIFREEDEIPLLQKALTLYIPSLSFVLIEEKKIIGFTIVGQTPTKHYTPFLATLPDGYELAFLGVSRFCQGRGLGSRLLKETLNAIFQRSKQFTCWLLVDVTNVSAIKMYQKLGFRQWLTTPSELSYKEGFVMGLSHRRYNAEQG